jgi:hypothetical protein
MKTLFKKWVRAEYAERLEQELAIAERERMEAIDRASYFSNEVGMRDILIKRLEKEVEKTRGALESRVAAINCAIKEFPSSQASIYLDGIMQNFSENNSRH